MIVQIQSGQTDTQLTKSTSSTSSTFSDVGLSVTITPKYSNSKIYVIATGNGYAATDR